MAPVTITAITNRIATPLVKDVLAQPLTFRLAADPEDSMLTVPPPNFVVLRAGATGEPQAGPGDAKQDDKAAGETADGDTFAEPDEQLFPRHRLPVHWTQRYASPPGFINNGVTCYMNSVLQVLLHVPAMVEYLLHVHRKDCQQSETCTMCTFCKLADECYGGGNRRKPIYPRFILKKLKANGAKFSDHRQEDAHEFLRQFIDALQLAVAPKHLKEPLKETSVIHRIFGGRFRQQIRCRKCDYRSNTFQPALDMQLDIRRGGSVEDALKKFFASEQLSKAKGNAYKCERCKTHVDAVKRSMICDAPEYVTLHLKRFDFTLRGTSKVHDFIRYPRVLDLSAYATVDEKLAYELIGVIVHQGRRASSGHYYAFCKQPDGTWANYNDEVVDRVTEKTALRQEAYILVYSRTTETNGVANAAGEDGANGQKRRKTEEAEDRAEEADVLKKRKLSGEFVKPTIAQKPMTKLFEDDSFGEPVAREEFENMSGQSGLGLENKENAVNETGTSDDSTAEEEPAQSTPDPRSPRAKSEGHRKPTSGQPKARLPFALKKNKRALGPYQPQDFSRSPRKNRHSGVHIGPRPKLRHQMNGRRH